MPRPGVSYQFERLGYFCVDSDTTPASLVFNRTVALRDTWAKIEKKTTHKGDSRNRRIAGRRGLRGSEEWGAEGGRGRGQGFARAYRPGQMPLASIDECLRLAGQRARK